MQSVKSFAKLQAALDPDAHLADLEAEADGGSITVAVPDSGASVGVEQRRVYRPVDLCDILRRRGRIEALHADGQWLAARYRPCVKGGEIAIYTGPSWQRWSFADIPRKGLGGSETAAVRLAEALSLLGWIVTVYGDVEDSGYHDVVFRHYGAFDPTVRRDAVISSRMPQLFMRQVNARSRMLWLHDIDVGDALDKQVAGPIDHVLVLSEWHERHVRERYPWLPGSKVTRIRNGISLDPFQPRPWGERAERLIYTSSPDRGLDVLLELWPTVLEKCPDAVFAFCYPDVYDRVADQTPEVGAFRDKIRALVEATPNVQALGSLSQPKLAELMCTSRVWAHPSWISGAGRPFAETSCIGAMEAQAAGCLVVASDWGALPETVKHGRMVVRVDDESWRAGFVTNIVDGLSSEAVGDWALLGHLHAEGMGWQDVAVDVDKLIPRPAKHT